MKKYVNGEYIEMTEEEIASLADVIEVITPSETDKLRADIDYIAIMTGVEL